MYLGKTIEERSVITVKGGISLKSNLKEVQIGNTAAKRGETIGIVRWTTPDRCTYDKEHDLGHRRGFSWFMVIAEEQDRPKRWCTVH